MDFRVQIFKDIEQFVPFYISLQEKGARLLRIPTVLFPIVFNLLWIGLAIAIVAATEELDPFINFWLRVNFSAALAGAMYFMPLAHARLMAIMDRVLYMTATEEDAIIVRDCVRNMLISKWQTIYCAFMAVVTACSGIYLGMPLGPVSQTILVISALLVGVVAASGLWFTFSFFYMVIRISKFSNVRLNVFEPTTSIGIKELVNFSMAWGIIFLLESCLVIFGVLMPPWTNGGDLLFWISFAWVGSIVVLLMLNFFLPGYFLTNLLRFSKNTITSNLQERINAIYQKIILAPEDQEDVRKHIALINDYQNLYLNVRRSNSSPIDYRVVVKFLASTVVPILIFVFKNPSQIASFLEMAVKFIGRFQHGG